MKPAPLAELVALTGLAAVAAVGSAVLSYEPAPEVVPLTVSSSTSMPVTVPDLPRPPALNSLPAPADIGSFAITGPAGEELISGADYDSMPYVLPLNPAGPQETMVRWVEGWGVPPSRAEEGTVYALGHAWATAPLVFNPLSEKVTDNALTTPGEHVETVSGSPVTRKSTDVLNGSIIRVMDEHGRGREWVIDAAWLVDKYEAIDDADLMDDTQLGRIVLIACSVDGADDLGYNVMVSGHLRPVD